MTRLVVGENQRLDEATLVRYRGHGLRGEGILKTISLTDGHIKGTTPVTEGMVLSLEIASPTGDEPVHIDRAPVQWVKGLEFGVDLTPQQETAERIAKLIAEIVMARRGPVS